MKPVRRFRHIAVDEQSIVPIYLQVSGSVVLAVKNGRLKNKRRLPSINLLSERLQISRDSAERAYRHLKATGVIVSIPQKGYYIRPAQTRSSEKIVVFPGGRDSTAQSLQEVLAKALKAGKREGYTCYAIVPHGDDVPDNKKTDPVAFIMIR